jgi:hypothetical protein
MIWLAEAFPDPEIVSALSKQLSWSHFVEILPLKDPLKRDFYAELCRVERWSVRTLRRKIGHMLYERTALSKKPSELIAHDIAALRDEDRMTPDLVFRDPYFLDFLCSAERNNTSGAQCPFFLAAHPRVSWYTAHAGTAAPEGASDTPGGPNNLKLGLTPPTKNQV